MNAPLSRRAALAGVASLPALAIAPTDLAVASGALPALFAAHRAAYKTFLNAADELEAAKPADDVRVVGITDCTYSLSNGQDRIAGWINDHFKHCAGVLKTVGQLSPIAAAEGLAAMERERTAALARLDDAFAAEAAAEERWQEANDAEKEALLAICAHRCVSPGELAEKFRYLSTYRDELSDEQREALFASLVPEGEA